MMKPEAVPAPGAAPHMMIVLDPDLETGSTPDRTALPLSRASRIPTRRTLARFLALAQAAVRLRGEVTVLLTTDTNIRRLNRQFRAKNKATDVLSFPAMDMPELKSAERPAGDLAISIDTARKQAAQQGHALLTEIKVLILHGLLHLAGYDHETDEGQMRRRERTLRARLGLPQGLIERASTKTASSSQARQGVPLVPRLRGPGKTRPQPRTATGVSASKPRSKPASDRGQSERK